MRLSAPKKITWWISLILAVLGVLGKYVAIPVISGLNWWLLLVGFLLLWLGTFIKGF